MFQPSSRSSLPRLPTQVLLLPIIPTPTQEFSSLTMTSTPLGTKDQVSSSTTTSKPTPELNTTMPSFKTQVFSYISSHTHKSPLTVKLLLKLTPLTDTETFSRTVDSNGTFSNTPV